MLFRRKHDRLKPLDEAAAYARCHGDRDESVRVVKLPPRRARYDLLATGVNVARHRRVDAEELDRVAPGLEHRGGGIVYHECATDDARLTLELARAAAPAATGTGATVQVDRESVERALAALVRAAKRHGGVEPRLVVSGASIALAPSLAKNAYSIAARAQRRSARRSATGLLAPSSVA